MANAQTTADSFQKSACLNKIKFLNADETAYFCYQLAVILDSGVPLYDGLTVFEAETETSSPEASELLKAINNILALERPLYEALGETGVFPEYCVKMVKAGEMSGKLEETLRGLSEYYEKQGRLYSNIRNAVLQPLIMMIIMLFVVLILIFKVLPMFADIFSEFDAAIAERVYASIEFSAVIGSAAAIFCGVICLAAVIVFAVIQSSSGRRALQKLVAVLPFTRKTSRAVSLSRFADVMSMMTSSGVSFSEALENAEEVCSDPYIAAKILECEKLILNENTFADALEQTELLSPIHTRTLTVSYRSGAFDTAWKKISITLSDEADSRLESITSAAEPLLTGLLTVITGVVLLSVMLPLTDIMSVL